MDLSFFRRAETRFANRTAAHLDFGMLVASLRAAQAASPAARALAGFAALPRPLDPLAEILLAGPHWRRAVAAQGGAFNAAFARKGAVN
ncbi:MAG TPA: hypothetical protein VGD66_14660 [Allosphingosinicella sp.]|jgi:hypothetical protein